jgi:predicted  nucleic acid-binding Zn-ribbon protein|tara:strand:- start:161 stop:478 length:318 start_codon:yes stop_codon:yes gene_type:complete
MNDVVEYTKWITNEMQKLKDRVKAAESVISDLRSSGEASVESLMETLYILKVKQEELESNAMGLRENIKGKEVHIKLKEEEKAAIKATVEVENADRENQIHALRK